jgi:4-carboxymuconolactone decarboxylase
MTDAPRIAPLSREQRSAEQQRLVEATGTELNIFATLVRHPKLFEVFTRFAGRLLHRSLLPEDVRETLILRTAYRCRAAYEWAQHREIARRVGMPRTSSPPSAPMILSPPTRIWLCRSARPTS